MNRNEGGVVGAVSRPPYGLHRFGHPLFFSFSHFFLGLSLKMKTKEKKVPFLKQNGENGQLISLKKRKGKFFSLPFFRSFSSAVDRNSIQWKINAHGS